MQLLELTCHRFRCLQDITFVPDTGVNVIRGRNAQGKTSLLEALLFLTTTKSHRTNVDSELSRHGEPGFHLSARIQRRDRMVSLEAVFWGGVKRFKVNGVAQSRLSDILGKANAVLFSPEDLELIKGSAAHRRHFNDMELSQLNAKYLAALQQFRQVLRQRNELLRRVPLDATQLDVWDAQFIAHAQTLMSDRAEFIEELAARAKEAYAEIAAGEPLDIRYEPNVASPADLEAVLRKTRDSDARRQMTTRGPHRDDMEFLIGGTPARSFASQGQQRTAALAVKLAEAALLHARTGEYPILMLDEALGELDDERARRLFSSIAPEIQCLITTADLTRRTIAIPRPCALFDVEHGGVARVAEGLPS
jgi:DNA replication and repair protein RecF